MAPRRTPKPLDLAAIVKARMEAKGISANALEQLVGGAVTRQTIGTFISGKGSMTSTKLAHVLAALELTVSPTEEKEAK